MKHNRGVLLVISLASWVNMKTETNASKTDRIIECARRLFLLNGFEKTTMEEIARSLSIGKGTLYALFPSKDEILMSICGAHVDQFLCLLRDKLTEVKSDYLQCLMEMLRAFATSVYEEAQSIRTPEAFVYISKNVKLRFETKFAELKRILRATLDKAVENGELPATADTAHLCEVVVTAITSYFPPYERQFTAQYAERPKRETFDKELNTLLDLLLYGLKGTGRA